MAIQASGDIVRVEPPRAAGAAGVWETSHELVAPAGGPWEHLTVLLVVSARDADSDESGEYRLLNVTQETATETAAYGLVEELRLVLADPASGDLFYIQRRPATAGADAWIIQAAATFHDQDLGGTSAPIYPPPAAVVLSAVGGDQSVTLSFIPPLGVTNGPSLMQYGWRQIGGNYTYSATGDVDGMFTLSAGLTNDVDYEAIVRFRVDSAGEWGEWSNPAPFTPNSGAAPLSAMAEVSFDTAGVVIVSRRVEAAAVVEFSTSGTITVTRNLAAVAVVEFSSTGQVGVVGALAAVAVVEFSSTGEIERTAHLQASADVEFSTTGTITVTAGGFGNQPFGTSPFGG